MNYIQTYYSNVVVAGMEKPGLWLSVFTDSKIDGDDLFVLIRSGDVILGKKRWPSARYCVRVVFASITDHDIEHGVGIDDDSMKMLAPDNFGVIQLNLVGVKTDISLTSSTNVFDYVTSDRAWKGISQFMPNTMRRNTPIGVFDSMLDHVSARSSVKGLYFNDIDMFWLSKDACKNFRVAHNKRIINPHMGKVDFSVAFAPDVLPLKQGMSMELITYENANNVAESFYKQIIGGPVPVIACSVGFGYRTNVYVSAGVSKAETITLGEDTNIVAIVIPCSFGDTVELEKIMCYAMNNTGHTFLFVDGTMPIDMNDKSLKYVLVPSMKQRINFIESFSYTLQ